MSKRVTYREMAERFHVRTADVSEAVKACRIAGVLEVYVGADGRTREVDEAQIEQVRLALIRLRRIPV